MLKLLNKYETEINVLRQCYSHRHEGEKDSPTSRDLTSQRHIKRSFKYSTQKGSLPKKLGRVFLKERGVNTNYLLHLCQIPCQAIIYTNITIVSRHTVGYN